MQKEVQRIQAASATSGKSRAAQDKEKEKALREKEKADEEKRRKEEAQFFKPIQTQKVPFGVDPKSVLCVYYKAGNCEKGNKCKFSHDMNVGRKVDKKNLYEDTREEKLAGECAGTIIAIKVLIRAQDTMDKWDEEKLRSVILSKGGNPKTTTDVCSPFESYPTHLTNLKIVCKFFIEAIESEK